MLFIEEQKKEIDNLHTYIRRNPLKFLPSKLDNLNYSESWPQLANNPGRFLIINDELFHIKLHLSDHAYF